MSLPSLPRTEHTFKSDFWPSVIKYRAFTSGQQTLMLQVADPDTPPEQRANVMNQLFGDCVNAGAPFDQLPVGVVEEIFVHMRSLSIGEVMKIRYQCKKEIEVEEPAGEEGSGGTIKKMVPCNQEVVFPIPLDEVKCVMEPGFKDVFDLPGGYHLKMRQPSFSNATSLQESNTVEALIASFIDCLYDDDGQVWKIENPDEPGITPELAIERRKVKEEFIKWVGDNIESDIITDISENFFHKIPRVKYENKLICPKCKGEHELKFNGINEIFI